MEKWLTVPEFAEMINLEEAFVRQLVIDKSVDFKEELEDGSTVIYIKAPSTDVVLKDDDSIDTHTDSQDFEKTIGTILKMHEKLLDAKDETICSLKSENQFLRDAIFSTQEIYEDDRKIIETLREQLKIAQEELEFMKKKYRLMWGKVASSEQKS
jgi:hypothetical protein